MLCNKFEFDSYMELNQFKDVQQCTNSHNELAWQAESKVWTDKDLIKFNACRTEKTEFNSYKKRIQFEYVQCMYLSKLSHHSLKARV
jgi:tetraacyldisaccharide-1-P 4'-kinase